MAIPTISKDNMTLLQLIDFLKQDYDENTVLYKVRDICLTTSSKDIRKKGMEFLYYNGLFDDLQQLVNNNKVSNDPSVRKWAKVYQYVLDVKHRNYNPITIIKNIEQCKEKDVELELMLLLEFTKIRAQYQMNYYQDAGNLLTNFDQYIQQIDDPYLRKSFRIRYHRVAMKHTLMQNEVLTARKHGYKLLALSPTPCIHVASHILLGKSYTFESYTQAMIHFQVALKLAKEHQFTSKINFIEQQAIPFISAHFNKPANITTTDIGEQAHLEIAIGNREKAIELLEQNGIDTPLKMYYLGKAKQDRTILVQAYKEFVYKQNNYFLSRLPLIELKDFFIG